jgi:hypothetical protein
MLNSNITATIGQSDPWNGAYRYLLFMSDPLLDTSGSATEQTTSD